MPAFRYYENSTEECTPDEELDIIRLLKDNGIRYSVRQGRITVDDVDIPDERISSYYIKESLFYDSANSSFRTQVTAICPVMDGDDEFEEGKVRYPLFWIRYSDIEQYLSDIKVFPNARNIRAKMAVTDYLARNMYNGKIYKVFNPQGLTLPQQSSNAAELAGKQERTEQEMKEIKTHTYDTFHP